MAVAEFQRALQIYPDDVDALSNYGLLESWNGNYQHAGQMLERALYMSARNSPDYDFIAVNLAALLMQTDHLDGALDLLNREIAQSPEYGRAWANRAVIGYKQGDLAPARSDAEEALRLDPNNAQAQNLLRLLGETSRSASQH